MTNPTVTCMVDWDGDHVLNHDLSSRVLSWNARGGADGGSDIVGASTASIVLDNRDGYFSPHDPTSAIYGLVPYGKEISLTSTFSAVTKPVFRGKVTDFSIDAQVQLDCADDSQDLREKPIRLLMQEGQRVDQIIAAALDAGSWSATRRNLDVSRRILPYFWSWGAGLWDVVQLAARQDLGGVAYMDRSGDVRFESAQHRIGKTSARTLNDSVQVRPSYRSTDLWNRAEFRVGRVQAATAASSVFSLSGAAPVVPALGSLELFGAFAAGARNVSTPAVGTDIKGNSQADGSGTNKSAQLGLTAFTAYGGGWRAVVANADSSPTYLVAPGGTSGVILTGYAVRPSSDDRTIAVDAVAPVVQYRTKRDQFDFTNDEAAVRAYGKHILAVSNQLSPRVAVQVPARDSAETADILTLGYSDLVTVDNSVGLYQSRLVGKFFIEGWRISQAAQEPIRAEWTLRSRAQGMGAVFRVSPAKVNGIVYSAITAPAAVPVDRIGW